MSVDEDRMTTTQDIDTVQDADAERNADTTQDIEPAEKGSPGSLWSWVRKNVFFQAVLFIFVSIIEYIMLETFLGDSVLKIGWEFGSRNLLLLLVTNLIFISLFHRLRPAMILSSSLFLVLGIANYFVHLFRGYGIVYADLFAMSTAGEVAGNYKYTLNYHFFAGLLLGISLFVICLIAPRRQGRYWRKRSILGSIGGFALSALLLLWIGFGSAFWEQVSSLMWDQSIGMAKYGYLLYVTANAETGKVIPPKGYSVQKVDEILNRYTQSSDKAVSGHQADSMTQKANSVTSPNLIMIMNESFADLDVLGSVPVSQPYLKFFHSLRKNTIHGYAESSVYGGYTANSEFEFLTGCTKAFVPGSPYLQYIHSSMPTLITNIKAQGNYQKAIAIHPYHPSGYNREHVYPLLGFDRFLSIHDFLHPVLVRKYISDAPDFQMIEKQYEQKKKGTSLCLFNVTMQNHNAYDDNTYTFKNPVELKTAKNPYRGNNFQENQYLSLVKMSDDAFKQLITYFKKVKEPTIIVMFGDHQPHLQDFFYQEVMETLPKNMTQAQVMQKYLVPFVIWANYDIGETQISRTSLNYLSTLMAQKAGLRLTDFQRYLLALNKKLPSISQNGFYDSQGKLHKWSEKNTKYTKLLHEYAMVQYNNLFDKKHRLTKHFQINQH
jgi:hypothetical protein